MLTRPSLVCVTEPSEAMILILAALISALPEILISLYLLLISTSPLVFLTLPTTIISVSEYFSSFVEESKPTLLVLEIVIFGSVCVLTAEETSPAKFLSFSTLALFSSTLPPGSSTTTSLTTRFRLVLLMISTLSTPLAVSEPVPLILSASLVT